MLVDVQRAQRRMADPLLLQGGPPEVGCTPDSYKCFDAWHTMDLRVADQEAQLEIHKQEMAAAREAKLAWREQYATLIAQTAAPATRVPMPPLPTSRT